MANQLDSNIVARPVAVAVVILLSIVVLPHVFHINIMVMSAFTFMILWKLLAHWIPWIPINRWLIILFAVVSFSISGWYYGPPLGRDPGTSFLIILLGLKILESRSNRDYRIVLVLGYFVVITNFLYQSSFLLVGFLAVVTFMLTWFLTQLGHVDQSFQFKRNSKIVLKLTIQAIPFALILFFLFPRFAGSLWLLQTSSNDGLTGMSDTLTMGAIANLVESREVAFTATFSDSNVPPSASRYWRGGVLWDTNGREWVKGDLIWRYQTDITPLGNVYNYEVEMQPTKKNWLFSLDIPIEQVNGAVFSAEAYLYKNDITKTPKTYKIVSSDRYINKTITDRQLERGIALPHDTVTIRMKNLITALNPNHEVTNKIDSALFATKILEYFNKNLFVYSLQPPLLLSNNPVDEFLFSSQKGFCEHYAASFVTLMRGAGIPARIVIGYLGGEHNPVTDQIVVRQSDAHAWAEFWDENSGWIRVDPTAAIAPDRIENPINYDLSINADGNVRFLLGDLGIFGSMFREARWYSALIKQKWQNWFVGYDFKRQKRLLSAFGLQRLNIQSLASFAFLLGLLILIGSAFIFYAREKSGIDKVSKLYSVYCKKFAVKGIERKSFEGPLDFYDRCKESFPNQKNNLYQITQNYLHLRYGMRKFDEQQRDEQFYEFETSIRTLNLEVN